MRERLCCLTTYVTRESQHVVYLDDACTCSVCVRANDQYVQHSLPAAAAAVIANNQSIYDTATCLITYQLFTLYLLYADFTEKRSVAWHVITKSPLNYILLVLLLLLLQLYTTTTTTTTTNNNNNNNTE